MTEQRSKRDKIEALIGIGLGVLGLLLLGYFLWINPPGSRSTEAPGGRPAATSAAIPAPTEAAIELWSAYEQARTAARAEAEDAQLTSASTQWQATSEKALLSGPETWSFVFYSPAGKTVLDIVVNREGASVVNQTRVWDAPQFLSEEAWKEGPRDALLAFLAHDGRTFLEENPQAIVDLHLGSGETRNVRWNIVALNPQDQEVLALQIDAETMRISPLAP
jgi:hypothetical protein